MCLELFDVFGVVDEGESDDVGVVDDEVEVGEVLLCQCRQVERSVRQIDALLGAKVLRSRGVGDVDMEFVLRRLPDDAAELAVVEEDPVSDLHGGEDAGDRAADAGRVFASTVDLGFDDGDGVRVSGDDQVVAGHQRDRLEDRGDGLSGELCRCCATLRAGRFDAQGRRRVQVGLVVGLCQPGFAAAFLDLKAARDTSEVVEDNAILKAEFVDDCIGKGQCLRGGDLAELGATIWRQPQACGGHDVAEEVVGR